MSELKDLILREPRRTLAVAESLTCGNVQAYIGRISGASEFFLGGITAYTLEQKVKLLGVNRDEAEKVNCVSAEIVEQMARGAANSFGADLALATTGYAEPSEEHDVAVPFAWWALAQRDGETWSMQSHRVECPDANRVEVQAAITVAAITGLLVHLRST
jgi:nicotinamide-nucleotide amidase